MIESKYIATTEAIKEVLWLRELLHEVCVLNDYVVVYSESQSSIHLCKNPIFHERIDIRLHFIRDIVSQEVVRLDKIHTQYNPSDMGTKVLPLVKFRSCKNLLNISGGK